MHVLKSAIPRTPGKRRILSMKRLPALALTVAVLAVITPSVRAQSNTPSCPPYAYYNPAVGQCVTNPTNGHGNH